MGMLVKSVQFFEAANELDTVVFDKTGTLTTGQLEVFQVDLHGSLSRDEVLSLASSLESHSTHPIAQAIVGFTMKSGLMIQEAKHVFEDHGLGMEGSVNGGSVLVGRFSWIESKGLTLVSSGELSQFSAIYVAFNQSHVGTIYLSDSIRKEAREVQHNLREAGISRFLMLTGDRSGAAEAIAAEIGFSEYQADCLPEQKLEVVKALKEEGHTVLVVGDGVNDAPALAAGNLSIAMGALGSDVAIKTADIALMSNDLSRVAQFITLSKKTVRVINQNILSGFLFSTVAIILSSAGYVTPMVACFIHEFGAFFVIFNSARLLKFDGR
jgi:Cd2+/Zn2+-exporting ATPase